MIEQNEMDGGTTFANGKRLQIVLDENGVWKRAEEIGAKVKTAPSSMDQASKRAAESNTPPVASMPPRAAQASAPTPPPLNPPTEGTGFKVPM